MLIRRYDNKEEKSLFKCDMCQKEIRQKDRKGIFVTNKYGRPIKKCDLCLDCYKELSTKFIVL